jgi:hypothetical protein
MPKSLARDERICNTLQDLRPFPEPGGMVALYQGQACLLNR